MVDPLKASAAALARQDADALQQVDAEFARLLQRYHYSLKALEHSGEAATDELNRFRLVKDHDEAKEAMSEFFRKIS